MKPIKAKRILFVGTGGGNDVFSTFLAAASLWAEGWRWESCDVGGVISPFHEHTGMFRMRRVPGVFYTTLGSARYLLSKNGRGKKIGFVDAKVAEILTRSSPYKMRSVLALSLENGTAGLTKAFKLLSKEYDMTVLVDVGGDCFYSGAEDTHVLSPMFDAMVVRAFVNSRARGVLFEAGPGTDGELEPESLTRALTANGGFDNATPLRPEVMDWWGDQYTKWIEPVRKGHTVPTTLQAFRSTEPFLQIPYSARADIGDVKKYEYFIQTISTSLCKKFYLVDLSRIKNPFAVSCASPAEWFVKTQIGIQYTNNEANLQYFRTKNNELWQFLTPSPLFGEKDREELVVLGLQNLSQGVIDGVWLRYQDWNSNWEPDWDKKFALDTGTVKGILLVTSRK